jgi:hypothetical protein
MQDIRTRILSLKLHGVFPSRFNYSMIANPPANTPAAPTAMLHPPTKTPLEPAFEAPLLALALASEV